MAPMLQITGTPASRLVVMITAAATPGLLGNIAPSQVCINIYSRFGFSEACLSRGEYEACPELGVSRKYPSGSIVV